MKLPIRILLLCLCAALIAAMPFVISAPVMLDEVRAEIQDAEEEGEESGKLLFPWIASARAEEDDLLIEDVEDGGFSYNPEWDLPVDLTPGREANPAGFTENGYEDDSIRVTVETTEEDDVTWHVARIQIASPTQLRTGIAGENPKGRFQDRKVSTMAEKYNAVVAMNGDWYTNDPNKTTFEYRMGIDIRSNSNSKKDILVIDEEGDFHLFIKSQGEGMKVVKKRKIEYEGTAVNAFTFGPALVKDGELVELDPDYGYNPHGKEPRSAVGQTGKLSYVFVIAEGRGESSGATHEQLAKKMLDLGCTQAFNLDGGNTAHMVFNGKSYRGQPGGTERAISDIIYFATAVPEESWQ